MPPEIEAIKHIGNWVDGKLVCIPDCPSITHKKNKMPPKTNEDSIVEIVERVRYVEFLRGVPVELPSETKELLRSGIRKALTEKDKEREEAVAGIIKMSDQLELECGKDGDKGTKQWMSFKGFRNAIRDKYITPHTN